MADEAGRNDRRADRGDRADAGTGQLEASVARGRDARTPFALLGSVAFLVWGAVAVLAVLLLLIWWVT